MNGISRVQLLTLGNILFTLMTISTLIPIASASKACFLGYQAHCTFTPFSTLICLFITIFLCRRLKAEKRRS